MWLPGCWMWKLFHLLGQEKLEKNQVCPIIMGKAVVFKLGCWDTPARESYPLHPGNGTTSSHRLTLIVGGPCLHLTEVSQGCGEPRTRLCSVPQDVKTVKIMIATQFWIHYYKIGSRLRQLSSLSRCTHKRLLQLLGSKPLHPSIGSLLSRGSCCSISPSLQELTAGAQTPRKFENHWAKILEMGKKELLWKWLMRKGDVMSH